MPDSPPHPLQQLSTEGLWGGPTYLYRGVEIRCCPGGHVCGMVMRDHPLNGVTFGAVGTITPLVDLWLDGERLLSHIRLPSPPP